MIRDKDQVIFVEFNAGTGAPLRQKLRTMSPVKRRFVISAVLAVLGTLTFLATKTTTFALLSSLPALMAVLFVMIVFARDEIVVAKSGISFPAPIANQLQHKSMRLWNELERAEVLTPYSHPIETRKCKSSALKLVFRSGASVVLPLNRFTVESLEQMVSAITKWGTECKKDDQLRQSVRLLQFEGCSPDADEGAYTRFWEAQLADSYSFSAFVPLARGKKLKQGTLTVQSELGCGGFSAIYLVKDSDGRQCILKEAVMPPGSDEALLERVRTQFERESQLLVRLKHERIARVFDHFVEDGRNYLLLEHINGPDLRERVRLKGACREDEVLKWAEQLTDVISYLHSQEPPVLHRDVTPDNIVLTPDGDIVLIDFGAANEFIGSATGTLIGKQSYMSPEQIRGKASPQSDIYALGATLYFLLAGRDPEPLSCKNLRQFNADVSEEMESLVKDMTRLDSHQRLADSAELAQRLSDVRNNKKAANCLST